MQFGVSRANQTIVLSKCHNPICKVISPVCPFQCGAFGWSAIVGRTLRRDVVPRQSTGFSDLKHAEAVRASLIAQAKNETTHGPTIAECAERYVASSRHELGAKAISQHRLLLDCLTRFCEARHAPYMRNLRLDLLDTFKTEDLPENMADTSKATAVATLRCFLRIAYRREWITDSLVDKVTAHLAVYEQKEPYSDEELKQVLDGASRNDAHPGWTYNPVTFELRPNDPASRATMALHVRRRFRQKCRHDLETQRRTVR
jgi:hypothetical protein